MIEDTSKFAIGQLVHHQLFEYRGVIIDVDATFQGTEEWYEHVAKSRPPKDAPWYRVLIHKSRRGQPAGPDHPSGTGGSKEAEKFKTVSRLS